MLSVTGTKTTCWKNAVLPERKWKHKTRETKFRPTKLLISWRCVHVHMKYSLVCRKNRWDSNLKFGALPIKLKHKLSSWRLANRCSAVYFISYHFRVFFMYMSKCKLLTRKYSNWKSDFQAIFKADRRRIYRRNQMCVACCNQVVAISWWLL